MARLPDQPVAGQLRARRVAAQTVTGDGPHVVVHEPGVEQRVDDAGHPARGVEVVDVRLAVRIDARQQRHDRRRSEMSSQVSVMPAARAIATRCMVWLVEPPVASSATHPLTMAFSSTTSPTGV